jgi:hypothetical protein
MAEDRAYDPKRRPNVFYKNDPESNKELEKRAGDRNQDITIARTVGDKVSEKIGYDQATGSKNGAKVSKTGKRVTNVNYVEHNGKGLKNSSIVTGATVSNLNVSGNIIGKTKKTFEKG